MRSLFNFHPLFRCVTSIKTAFTMEKKIALLTIKGPPPPLFFFGEMNGIIKVAYSFERNEHRLTSFNQQKSTLLAYTFNYN